MSGEIHRGVLHLERHAVGVELGQLVLRCRGGRTPAAQHRVDRQRDMQPTIAAKMNDRESAGSCHPVIFATTSLSGLRMTGASSFS